jgi:hypothetical protein
MTNAGFCPHCGAPRSDWAKFCGSCGKAYDTPPPTVTSPPEPFTEPPTFALDESYKLGGSGMPGSLRGWLIALLGLAILAGGYYILNNRVPSIGGGGVSEANLPPAGTIWFGSSFDPTTFELRGRTTTISSQSAFSAVAHLMKSMEGSALTIRISYNGTIVSSSPVTWQGSGEVWGFSPGALLAAGQWRYELVDVGGNILAGGTITAS